MPDIVKNYVKFLRGNAAAFQALETKDTDTLYFISETGEKTGKLYLGNVLIAGAINPDGTEIIDTLAELKDVNLGSTLTDGMVLAYDSTTAKWIPKTIETAVKVTYTLSSEIVENGTTIKLVGSDSSLSSVLIEHAKIGDINAALANVYTKTEIDNKLSQIGQLKRKIITNISEIDLTDATSENYIYMILANNGANNIYDEYIVINNGTTEEPNRAVEKIGSTGTNSNYITSVSDDFIVTEAKELQLNDLSSNKIIGLDTRLGNIETQVTNIESLLNSGNLVTANEFAEVKNAVTWGIM